MQRIAPPHLHAGDSAVAGLIAEFEWEKTSLGPIASWPQSLRTALSIILHSPLPMALMWGPTGVMLYNDAYAKVAGSRHPSVLGVPVAEGWPEVRAFNLQVVATCMAGGALTYENQHFLLYRDGRPDDVWLDLTYSPVLDERGMPGGTLAVVIETTERNLANERLNIAQEAGQMGSFEWIPEEGLVIASEQFYKLWGLKPNGPLRHDRLIALIEPEHRSRSAINRETEPDPLAYAEYRIRRADTGELRWLARRGEAVHGDSHARARYIGVVWDITERKKTEFALREADERIQLALDAGAVLGTWVWDVVNDRFVGDERFARTFSLDADALRHGLAIASVTPSIHPEDLPVVMRLVQAAIERGGPYRAEYRVLQADGGYRWVEANGRCELDAAGAALRFPGVLVDIQERKRAELELLHLNETLEQTIESRTRERDQIWNVVRDLMVIGDAEGRFLRVNPAWERMLGWAPEELLGRDSSWIEHPDDVARTREQVRDLGTVGFVAEFRNRFRHRDGHYRDLSWTAVAHEGRIYALARDITDALSREHALEEAEEALRQSQKMEAIGQLTGGIAHDFNNMLQGILAPLQIIRIRLEQGQTHDLERFITAASGSAKRAAALTQRLLAFARRQPLDIKPVDINSLVHSMEYLLQRTLGENILVDLQLAPILDLAQADPNQLENTLLNLVINARDAMPEGGTLSIVTRNMTLDAAAAQARDELPAGRYVMLSVRDTGTGMTPEVRAKAFDPFFTTKPLGQGTGLGLSMIYGYVKQAGGHVELDSTPGEGSRVTLLLPASPMQHDFPEESGDAPAPRGTGETVLVVEDDGAVRMVVTELLRELGYQVIEAADGHEGLARLEGVQRLDLLISDVGLPGINGRQLADFARSRQPGLRVLFMTGYAEQAATRANFLDAGMAMITKPFAIETLATEIRGMLGR